MMRLACVLAACFGTIGAVAPGSAPVLDSQVVLNRYMQALARAVPPKNVVFTYALSQAGPHNLDQTHVIYRSQTRQRDEVTVIDGAAVRPPAIRIISRSDRYTVTRLAPRTEQYVFLFLSARKNGPHREYLYATSALHPSSFTVTQVAIDGTYFLPTLIRFTTRSNAASGSGTIAYARFSQYWMPRLATVNAKIAGKPARERIAWSAYRFPLSLPSSTFAQPRPVALPTPSPF
ncbi:MAG: hypothetical protein DLM50_04685 [Candidatus Meridianibacter frigidus]|nr:MAG: hypothetical protein DLM50_04685 [Candidatus Eremiobacteraeota bacterium]